MQATLYNLVSHPHAAAHCDALVVGKQCWTWADLARIADNLVGQLSDLRGQRVALVHSSDGPSWGALAALDSLNADVFLLDPAISQDDLRNLLDEFQLAAAVCSAGADRVEVQRGSRMAAGSGQSSVTILTSGTSGKPKAVRHTWASLCRPVRPTTGDEPPVWLLTYRPNLYAGLQVALQCLVNGGTLVSPETGAEVDQIIDLMARQRVAFASATPSYWRRLLIFGDAQQLRRLQLQQITLGGELVDQQVLDMLQSTFPAARVVHIYATSELGRCFSVTDGRAGFPAQLVGAPSAGGVEIRVENDELLVRSANAMLGYDGPDTGRTQFQEWFATGDLIRREGDRYVFVGRRCDVINVGGNKVYPQEVEPVLRSVAGVADVRVYGKPSSLAGQLVAVQVVAANPAEAESVKAKIVEVGLRQLAAYQRPRLIEMVERIELSEAGKMVRR